LIILKINEEECPEFIIKMILSKLDEKNNKEKEIVRLWRESIIPIDSIESLINKLNEIISKLNNEGTIIKYYNEWDYYKWEYK
jgi:hypothetical protein